MLDLEKDPISYLILILLRNVVNVKEYYIIITFCSELMRNMDIIGYEFVSVGVGFLAFNVLRRIKSELKVRGN